MSRAGGQETAFLLDVDNTVLDNDRFEHDLRAHLLQAVGHDGNDAFWRGFEARRAQCGYADYLGTVQRCFENAGRDTRWLPVGGFMLDYPFADRLYDGALELLAGLAARGPTWLISDGDGVMQPRKLQRAGLWDAVSGRVRIYVHKQTRLDEIARLCPAAHYVFVDDKIAILDAVKRHWRQRVTTVLPQQGHYATKRGAAGSWLPADVRIPAISALAQALVPPLTPTATPNLTGTP